MTHTLVDSHVHFHGGYDLERFFDAAAANFAAAERKLGRTGDGCWSLWLAETHRDDYFGQFVGCATRQRRWRVEATPEPITLRATGEDGRGILLVAGRQIETREGLEVLALGTVERFERQMSFGQALRAAVDAGAIAVVPWGFGKWWFRRGRLLEKALWSPPAPFQLGDNGGRPQRAREPRHFRIARTQGRAVLPGSDPLPLPGEMGKVGRYGFVLDDAPLSARPAGEIKERLRELSGSPRPFGRRERWLRFSRVQIAMQLRARGAR